MKGASCAQNRYFDYALKVNNKHLNNECTVFSKVKGQFGDSLLLLPLSRGCILFPPLLFQFYLSLAFLQFIQRHQSWRLGSLINKMETGPQIEMQVFYEKRLGFSNWWQRRRGLFGSCNKFHSDAQFAFLINS